MFFVVQRAAMVAGFAVLAACASFIVSGCGKSGPPLPPLVKLPVPPADLLAERRGDTVDLQFTVPNTNTDGSRPANVDRVEVYAVTTAGSMTEDEIIRHGTRITTVDVKAPRDPNRTVGPDESEADAEPPEGSGLDQGAVARVAEPLTAALRAPVEPSRNDTQPDPRTAGDGQNRPLLGPAAASPSRAYVAVPLTTRGRKGPASKPVSVPLGPPPPPPGTLAIAYDEKAVTLTWMPVTLGGMVQQPATGDILVSTPIGVPRPTVAYHVYDVSSQEAAGPANKLTKTPITETRLEDARMTWGERRCYSVRTVETLDTLTVEGEAAPAQCTMLVDTFPPTAPRGLQVVAGERSISLIWDPNSERDLAGYLVFRGALPGQTSQQITPAPIEQAMLNDGVERGVRYAYVVKAVDRAGNVSAPSAQAEGMAR